MILDCLINRSSSLRVRRLASDGTSGVLNRFHSNIAILNYIYKPAKTYLETTVLWANFVQQTTPAVLIKIGTEF